MRKQIEDITFLDGNSSAYNTMIFLCGKVIARISVRDLW